MLLVSACQMVPSTIDRSSRRQADAEAARRQQWDALAVQMQADADRQRQQDQVAAGAEAERRRQQESERIVAARHNAQLIEAADDRICQARGLMPERPDYNKCRDALLREHQGEVNVPTGDNWLPVQWAKVQVPARTAGESVPLEISGGTFVVPVLVNDQVSLKFTLDSGAADVTIPADVVFTLMRAGSISGSDFLGSQTYVLADGAEVPSRMIRIHSLRVGGVVVHDVVGSVTSVRGLPLLGQSFLSRLSSWSIDNQSRTLIINSR